jgi:hypothetical protein
MVGINETYVGVCSNCGGDVVLPEIWYGTNKPEPRCGSCGAIAKKKGPIIEMEIPQRKLLEE